MIRTRSGSPGAGARERRESQMAEWHTPCPSSLSSQRRVSRKFTASPTELRGEALSASLSLRLAWILTGVGARPNAARAVQGNGAPARRQRGASFLQCTAPHRTAPHGTARHSSAGALTLTAPDSTAQHSNTPSSHSGSPLPTLSTHGDLVSTVCTLCVALLPKEASRQQDTRARRKRGPGHAVPASLLLLSHPLSMRNTDSPAATASLSLSLSMLSPTQRTPAKQANRWGLGVDSRIRN